jgi:hypothetical protein
MNVLKGFLAVFLFAVSLNIAAQKSATFNVEKFDPVIKEANDSFFYNGEPIHPGLLKQFIPWASDRRPTTITVDVAAAYQSNQYHQQVTYKYKIASITDTADCYLTKASFYFSYEYLGRLSNGLHVIRTRQMEYDNGSGDLNSPFCYS